jgi:hypothetical protein
MRSALVVRALTLGCVSLVGILVVVAPKLAIALQGLLCLKKYTGTVRGHRLAVSGGLQRGKLGLSGMSLGRIGPDKAKTAVAATPWITALFFFTAAFVRPRAPAPNAAQPPPEQCCCVQHLSRGAQKQRWPGPTLRNIPFRTVGCGRAAGKHLPKCTFGRAQPVGAAGRSWHHLTEPRSTVAACWAAPGQTRRLHQLLDGARKRRGKAGPIMKRHLGRASPPCASLDASKTPVRVLLQGGKGHHTCMVVSIDIIFMQQLLLTASLVSRTKGSRFLKTGFHVFVGPLPPRSQLQLIL